MIQTATGTTPIRITTHIKCLLNQITVGSFAVGDNWHVSRLLFGFGVMQHSNQTWHVSSSDTYMALRILAATTQKMSTTSWCTVWFLLMDLSNTDVFKVCLGGSGHRASFHRLESQEKWEEVYLMAPGGFTVAPPIYLLSVQLFHFGLQGGLELIPAV